MRSTLTICFALSCIVAVCSLSSAAQSPVTLSMSIKPSAVPAGGRANATITANIEGDWRMYSITQGPGGPTPARITLAEGPATLGRITGTRPKVKLDPNFGINTETYSGSASFNVPFTVNADAVPGESNLKINFRYQVCNDTVCLPPRTLSVASALTISLSAAKPSPTPSGSPSATPSASPNANAKSNADANTSDLTNAERVGDRNGTLSAGASTNSGVPVSSDVSDIRDAESETHDPPIWGFIWLAITFGALSLLTPCVFPMIPITVSYFTKRGSDSGAGSVRDALVYALGIVLTFTGLGVALALIIGASGLNRFASSPYTNLLITGIFLAFAFSLLGAYNIGVPASVLTRLDRFTRSSESGGLLGPLLMGLTFSLTTFTCTAPLMGTILVAAAGGQLLYPVLGMLAFSTVFALPFFVLAVAPNLLKSLPRSGSWMNSVKVVLGFLEIGAALKFLSNVDLIWRWGIFTREVVIAGWIALSILILLYLLGVFRFAHDSDDRSIGLVRVLNAFLFGTLTFYLLTGLFGSRLGEIESFLPPAREVMNVSESSANNNGELSWIINDYEAAVKQAQAENKKIFIDFTGYTCTNCRWMEANMFPKPAVRTELEKFVRVRLFTDGEGQPYEGFQQMQEKRFGTVALPLYAILTPADQITATFEGLTRSEQEFVAFLKKDASAKGN